MASKPAFPHIQKQYDQAERKRNQKPLRGKPQSKRPVDPGVAFAKSKVFQVRPANL